MKKLKVGIVGCGIAGLTVANLLRAQGHEITILEKHGESKPVGAGILLSANAMLVMKKIGAYKKLVRLGQKINYVETKSWNGKTLSNVDSGKISSDYDSISVGIHRHLLHSILQEQIESEGNIIFNFSLSEVVNNEERVILIDSDNKQYEFDLVVGCDGLHSQLRSLVLGESSYREHSHFCWRGVLEDRPNLEVETHKLQEIWGTGRRFGIMKIDEKRTYWYAVMLDDEIHFEKDDFDKLALEFEGSCGQVSNIIRATDYNAITGLPLLDKKETEEWHSKNIVFVGDSIHPTTPNLGQGAAMAIESSFVLANCIENNSDLEKAFMHYKDLRKPRTDMVTNKSIQIGDLTMLKNRIGIALRNISSRLLPSFLHEKLHRSFLNGSPAVKKCDYEFKGNLPEKKYNYDRFRTGDYNFSKMKGPKVGEIMLEAEFFTIGGQKVFLSDYVGKKVVIETGSMTCPMYVKNIERMNQLAREFSDVVFLLIYVREAHPGEKLKGHKNLDDKIECAKKLAELESESRLILIDKLDGDFHRYAGGLPEMLYILDEDQKVIVRSSWADPQLVECTLIGELTPEQQIFDVREPTKPDPLIMLRATLRGGILGTWDLVKSIPKLLILHRKNGEKKFKGC